MDMTVPPVNPDNKRLTAKSAPLNAFSLKVAMSTNRPKVREPPLRRCYRSANQAQISSPLRTCVTPGGSVSHAVNSRSGTHAAATAIPT